MPNLPLALPFNESEFEANNRLGLATRVILCVIALIVIVNAAGWLLKAVGASLMAGLEPMNLEAMLLTTLSGLSLAFSHPRYSKVRHLTSILLGCAVALIACGVIFEYAFHVSLGIDTVGAQGHLALRSLSSRMALQSALGFAALGAAEMFATALRPAPVLASDVLTFSQAAIVLTVVAGHFIAISQLFDSETPVTTSTQTMICLFLVSAVLLLRRIGIGAFAIFLGSGSGSKVARALAPLMLALPYVREALRAHFIRDSRMPSYYTTAIVGTVAVFASSAILIYLARRMNLMESEIHDLSLRDELTDLYNLGGFRLLAEQALRLARRLNTPFSVLFIDLDDLKKTNDTFGHKTGSDLLVEISEILRSSFRETDVVGRIGGDEFAVAGQFSEEHIAEAARQLEVSAEVANRGRTHEPTLSFSVGWVTMSAGDSETLDNLMVRADQAMYKVKRRRKHTVT